jgi:hypothetical protein
MPLFAAPRTEGLQSRFLSPADLVSDAPQPDQTAPSGHPAEDRLGSWKEIAAYLKRDVTTVQRWERREGMPVHRHLHDKAGSVYAFRAELDAWVASRKVAPVFQGSPAPSPDVPAANRRGTRWGAWTIAAVLAGAGGLLAWQMAGRNGSADNPLHDARFVQLTNFDGNEHGAALSPDGRFVAFLSNRDGPTDVWVTQVGADSLPTSRGTPDLSSSTRLSVPLASRPTGPWSPSGHASRVDRADPESVCSRRRFLAVPRARIWKGWPNSTGPAAAIGSFTTRRARGTPRWFGIPARRRGKSSPPLRACTLTSPPGRPTKDSSTSCRASCPTAWTSGAYR